MKKIILCCTMVVISLTLSAQNKKEMQAIIENLQTGIENLQATVSNQAQTIESLQTELNQTKSSLMMLQQSLLTQQQAITDLQTKQAELAKQAATANPAAAIITRQDSVADFYVRFRAVEDWQDLLPMVMDPEGVKPLMKKYYEAKGYGAKTLKYENVKNDVKKIKNNLYLVDNCYVVVTSDGFKVDWKGSYMHYMCDTEALLTKPAGTTATIWYNASINSWSKYTGWNSYFVGRDAFVKAGTTLDKKLQALLENGRRNIIVNLRVNTDANGDKFLEITELVSDSWSQY